jgi:hypothetical protein
MQFYFAAKTIKAILVATSKKKKEEEEEEEEETTTTKNTRTLLTQIHNILGKNSLKSSAVFLSLFDQGCDAPKASSHFIVQKHPPFRSFSVHGFHKPH